MLHFAALQQEITQAKQHAEQYKNIADSMEHNLKEQNEVNYSIVEYLVKVLL